MEHHHESTCSTFFIPRPHVCRDSGTFMPFAGLKLSPAPGLSNDPGLSGTQIRFVPGIVLIALIESLSVPKGLDNA